MRAKEAEAQASAASTGKGGRNLPGTAAGAEARTEAGGETKPEALRPMEAAVERSNMLGAYERVVKNQGALHESQATEEAPGAESGGAVQGASYSRAGREA